MAVDYRGQPITNQTAFTTTGIMNKKPAALRPLKMPTTKAVEKRATEQRVVERPQPQIDLSNLKDNDKRILNIHLTPSFKKVLSKYLDKIYSLSLELKKTQWVYQQVLLLTDLDQ